MQTGLHRNLDRLVSVLDAISRALQLDDAARAHLFHLAQAADGTSATLRPRRRAKRIWTPPPALQWVLDAITQGPAIVRNGRMDLLATNPLGRAMHSSLYDRSESGVPNFARYPPSPDSPSRSSPPSRPPAPQTPSPCSPPGPPLQRHVATHPSAGRDASSEHDSKVLTTRRHGRTCAARGNDLRRASRPQRLLNRSPQGDPLWDVQRDLQRLPPAGRTCSDSGST